VGGLSSWLLEFCGFTLVASSILAATSLAGCNLKTALAWSLVPNTVRERERSLLTTYWSESTESSR